MSFNSDSMANLNDLWSGVANSEFWLFSKASQPLYRMIKRSKIITIADLCFDFS